MSEMKNALKNFDAANLYSQELVLDPNAGEIAVLTPITVGRVRDTTRPIRFLSSITVTLRGMPRMVRFEIEASSLEDALSKWSASGMEAGERFVTDSEQQMLRSKLAGGSAAATIPNTSRMN